MGQFLVNWRSLVTVRDFSKLLFWGERITEYRLVSLHHLLTFCEWDEWNQWNFLALNEIPNISTYCFRINHSIQSVKRIAWEIRNLSYWKANPVLLALKMKTLVKEFSTSTGFGGYSEYITFSSHKTNWGAQNAAVGIVYRTWNIGGTNKGKEQLVHPMEKSRCAAI